MNPGPTQTPQQHSEQPQTVQPMINNTPVEPTAAQTASIAETTVPEKTSPGVLILQWLTYAFWGWVILALGFLIGADLSFFMHTSDSDYASYTPYFFAATIILSIVAFGCELFYRRKEPLAKKGFATALMVIHAVIFAIFGIGSLTIALFILIAHFTSVDASNNSFVGIATMVIVTCLYATTFLRTIAPRNPKKWSLIQLIVMSITVLGALIAAVAGPIVSSAISKQDLQVSATLQDIDTAVQTSSSIRELPATLHQIATDSSSGMLSDTDRTIIAKRLVTYDKLSASSYRLCGTFTTKQTDSAKIYQGASTDSPDFGDHEATKKCWTLHSDSTTDSDSLNPSMNLFAPPQTQG